MKVKTIFAAFLIGTLAVSVHAGDKALTDSEAKKILNALYSKTRTELISQALEKYKKGNVDATGAINQAFTRKELTFSHWKWAKEHLQHGDLETQLSSSSSAATSSLTAN